MPLGEATGAASARLGAPGQIIDGRYRLESLLGAGGFGEVWRATQEVEGSEIRPVALKLLDAPSTGGDGLPTPLGAGSGSLGSVGGHSWLDEVRAVRDVRCDAIATIFDVGISREPRLAFIAMELLEGATLDDRLRAGPVYWRRALAVAREIATALVSCHAVDVTHCDLKPQNVFLASHGKVYVLDFGVAALGEGQRSQVAPAAEAGGLFEMGATGAVSLDEVPGAQVPAGVGQHIFGTPGYIAPESFRGEPPGPASDVFALGVLIYRMLSGRLPQRVGDAELSTGPSTIETQQRYQAALSSATAAGDFEPLLHAVPDCPRGVARLVDQLLDADPERRPLSELVAAIDEVIHRPHGIPDPPYVGLAAFDAQRAGYIAGRDGDIEEVTLKLADSRAVVLAGPSGCGKSSLAIAGVAHRIDEQMLAGRDGWRLVTLRPNQGAESLRVAGDAEVARPPDDHTGTVVVVDQLEEVVRLDDADRVAFCHALATLVEATGDVVVCGRRLGPGDAVRVIATCRDDLFGRVASLPELRRFPERNLFTVRGVEPNAMEQIALGPARAAGYELEGGDEVVAEAVRIVTEDSGALPLVQFALTRWWEGRDRERRVLPRAVWREIGGIEGALAEAAQTLYDRFDDGERDEMRSLLLAMFRPDGTRVRVDAARVVTTPASRAVLARLVERRLVTRHTREAGATLEVVHEALGRRWPLLHTWLEETRSERELIADVQFDAERWRNGGRPVDLLWRGARLEAALRLRSKVGDDEAFLAAAEKAAGRQAWQRRGFAGLLAAVLAIAVVMVLSYLASNRQRERARTAQAVAETERAKAEDALSRNIGLREQAEKSRSEAQVAADNARRAMHEAEREKKRAEEQTALAEVEARANAALREKAEAAESVAERAMHRAQSEKAEADRQRQLNREVAARAEMQLREAASKLRYAETAKRLHELARARLEQIEREHRTLQAEHIELQKKAAQCRKGDPP